jgi:TetR/AcrR family transcriptional repressor of lmrAB and yxaGH operons
VNDWAAETSGLIRRTRAASPTARAWVRTMAARFADELSASGYTEGLPVTMITLDSVPGSSALTSACRSAYDGWLTALEEGLAAYGIGPGEAAGLARLMLAGLEGAVVLCRVYESTEPLDQVVSRVLALIPE